jgi:hypothetical protein
MTLPDRHAVIVALIGLTPAGVPVRMTSPGPRVAP